VILVLFVVATSFELRTRHLIILMVSPTSADKIRDINFNYFAAEDSNLCFYLHQNRSKNLRIGIVHLYVKAIPVDVPALKGCKLFVS